MGWSDPEEGGRTRDAGRARRAYRDPNEQVPPARYKPENGPAGGGAADMDDTVRSSLVSRFLLTQESNVHIEADQPQVSTAPPRNVLMRATSS